MFVHADTVTSTASSSFDTDTVAGDEALSPFKIATAYSGSTTTGKAETTAGKEGTGGSQLSILIQSSQSKQRLVSCRHAGHLKQHKTHSNARHHVEAEVMVIPAQEITAEIDQEILGSLRSLAATEETFNQAAVSGTATYVGDEHAALAVLINRTANKIAQRTRPWCR